MRTNALSILAAVALSSSSVVLAGCGSEAPRGEVTGNVASAVQGGTLDTKAQHAFAVGIANKFGGVCSGTLIAPNLVLTARHCVVKPEGSDAVSCSDNFGPSVAASALFVTTEPNLFRAESYYAATKIITPTPTGFCGNDIALIILQDSIPETEAKAATPVVQFKMTDARISDSITAMGYGITSPSANDSGQRRIRENIPVLCIPGSTDLACDGQLEGISDSDAEFVTEGYVCSGDSGGGAFDQKSFETGTPYVLGALSRGPQTETRCLAAIYSRTDAHAQMIIDAGIAAAEQGGYPAPAWTRSETDPGDVSIAEPTAPCAEGDTTCTESSATDPAPATTTRTTTTGCSVVAGASGTGPSSVFSAFGLALVGLAVAARRRRS